MVAEGASSGEPWDGPRNCMAAIVQLLDELDRELSGNQLHKELRLAGHAFKDRTIDVAAEQLALAGVISVRTGARNARLYRPQPTSADLSPAEVGGGGQ